MGRSANGGLVDHDPRRRYYVMNYGFVWSLTLDALRRFLRNGADGGEWNLHDYGTELGGGPWYRERGDGPPARFVGHYLIKPLDWLPEEFAYHLQELEEALNKP